MEADGLVSTRRLKTQNRLRVVEEDRDCQPLDPSKVEKDLGTWEMWKSDEKEDSRSHRMILDNQAEGLKKTKAIWC